MCLLFCHWCTIKQPQNKLQGLSQIMSLLNAHEVMLSLHPDDSDILMKYFNTRQQQCVNKAVVKAGKKFNKQLETAKVELQLEREKSRKLEKQCLNLKQALDKANILRNTEIQTRNALGIERDKLQIQCDNLNAALERLNKVFNKQLESSREDVNTEKERCKKLELVCGNLRRDLRYVIELCMRVLTSR